MVKNARLFGQTLNISILRPQFKIGVARVRPWGKFFIPIFFFLLMCYFGVHFFFLKPEVVTIFDLGLEVVTILIWGQKC